ncbi:unnamed protein product [Mytilus edulis]|uniref:Uncharacterized protein n=1 Tax=Mytilus edulis TaxID=6550 RepID=A0A8S3SJ93_MYTED|nr:unnamed protein product [Mytilus edulis]
MDWFNNIGCEELENEAVAYFEQYIGLIPEVLASSNNELNVSDNIDSDIENDESDIENTCDTIQARAREFYSTSVIQDQSEFTKAERDIYLLSKLENLEITDSVFRGGKRERKRYRYSFQGVEICEFTWRNIYNIGRSEFKSLKQHLNANGVTPRSHGLSGRKSNHGHSFEVIENTIKFIKRKSDINTVSQLVKIVDNSAKCNRSEVYNENDDDENSLKWYRWDNFFTKYFKPLRGIGKFHHFRFTSDEVGVVFARETLDQPEKRLVLLKESANLPELLTTLPEVIQPAGLTEERRRYLYNEVRPFVQFNFRDEFCPRASEE